MKRPPISTLPGFRYDGSKKTATLSVIVPNTGGRVPRRRTVLDVTRDEALSAWKAFREKTLNPKPPTDPVAGPFTLRTYVDRYWPSIVLSVRPRTRRGYETHLRHLVLPELGDLELPRINAAAVRDFAGRMKAGINRTASRSPIPGGYAANTISHCLAILRRILRDAVDREELAVYPIRGRLPKQKPELLKLELSEEERAKFLAAFDDGNGFRDFWSRRTEADERKRAEKPIGFRRHGGPWFPDSQEVEEHFRRFRASKPFFTIALETALRRGDLLGLLWSSVDLVGGWIRVRMSKTGEEAVIPISDDCRAALDVLRFKKEEGGPVFPGASWTVLGRYFVIAKEVAGITRRFRLHDCRHTLASRLASAGVSLQVIAKILGHTSVQMSQRYARPDERALKAAIQSLAVNFLVNSQAPRMDRGAV